jgi:hypothetical protein
VKKRALLVAVGAIVVAVAAGLALPNPAKAYGPDALWQIGLSFNCNSPTACAPMPGGFWGWAEFDRGGEGDAQLVDCSHLTGGGPAPGAQHFSVDVHGWTIGPGSAGPRTFIVTSETDTVTGRSGGPPVTIDIPSESMDTGIPAVPGHYTATDIFGMKPPPGISIQIQVVQVGPS